MYGAEMDLGNGLICCHGYIDELVVPVAKVKFLF